MANTIDRLVSCFTVIREHSGRAQTKLDISSSQAQSSCRTMLVASDNALPLQMLFSARAEYLRADCQLMHIIEAGFMPPVTVRQRCFKEINNG